MHFGGKLAYSALGSAAPAYLCKSTVSTNSARTIPFQWFNPVPPQLTSFTVGSIRRIACAHCHVLVAYTEAVCCPTCHSPQTLLPRPQDVTLWDLSLPVFLRRRLAWWLPRHNQSAERGFQDGLRVSRSVTTLDPMQSILEATRLHVENGARF